MEKEITSFWDQLELFLFCDDDARWKAIGWIILVVGVAGSLDLVAQDSPVEDAVRLMGALTLILSIVWIGCYCTLGPRQRMEPQSTSRRSLMLRASASAIGLFVGACLSRIQAQVLNSDLLRAAKTNDYGTAAHVFERARTASVRLDKTLVRNASQRLISAADQPAAWNAVLHLADYRTVLNADAIPHLPNVRDSGAFNPGVFIVMLGAPELLESGPGIPLQLRSVPAEIWLAGNAPPETAAKTEPLDNPYPVSSDAQFIIFDWKRPDVALLLDDMYLKNVIVRNARINYSGGPARLDNVYFVNCTFEILQQPHGQEFAKALLDTSSITFHAA